MLVSYNIIILEVCSTYNKTVNHKFFNEHNFAFLHPYFLTIRLIITFNIFPIFILSLKKCIWSRLFGGPLTSQIENSRSVGFMDQIISIFCPVVLSLLRRQIKFSTINWMYKLSLKDVIKGCNMYCSYTYKNIFISRCIPRNRLHMSGVRNVSRYPNSERFESAKSLSLSKDSTLRKRDWL